MGLDPDYYRGKQEKRANIEPQRKPSCNKNNISRPRLLGGFFIFENM
jgi:hypothetical protein